MNEPDDDARLRAATWIASDEGLKLLDFALSLCNEGVFDANSRDRLSAMAGRFVATNIAAQAAVMAWTMAVERRKAVAKLGEMGAQVLFDSPGLQMASSRTTASYHSHLFKQADAENVSDMTAGIGIDAINFAREGIGTTAFESDPVRAIFAQRNGDMLSPSAKLDVLNSDSTCAPFPSRGFVYADPPRRTESTRWGNLGAAETMIAFIAGSRPLGALVKLAPAVDRRIGDRFDAQLEFISAGGECKEALLRIGALKSSDDLGSSAVLLPGGERLSAQEDPPSVKTASPEDASYLYEPDPAVIRAGLTSHLAARHGMALIAPNIAYLLSQKPAPTPFANGYEILCAMPYHRRTVQAWLDQHDAGTLIIKKRGVGEELEQVSRQLRLSGSSTVIMALARQSKRVWAIFLKPL